MPDKTKTKSDKAAEAASLLADALNSYGNSPEIEVFCEAVLKQHRTLQQSIFKCMLTMISRWALSLRRSICSGVVSKG